MANASILAAFERMWKNVTTKLGNYLPISGGSLTGNLSTKNLFVEGYQFYVRDNTDLKKANAVHIQANGFDTYKDGKMQTQLIQYTDENSKDGVSFTVSENSTPAGFRIIRANTEAYSLTGDSYGEDSGTDIAHRFRGTVTADSIDTPNLSCDGNAYLTDISVSGSVSGITPSKIGAASTSQLSSYKTKQISDTRSNNQTPQWYMSNYPKQDIYEFKQSSTVGVTGYETYGVLQTIIPWSDSSGGYPKQIFRVSNREFRRVGTSNTAWGSWADVSDASHTHSYLPLSGGTLTGNLKVSTVNNFSIGGSVTATGSNSYWDWIVLNSGLKICISKPIKNSGNMETSSRWGNYFQSCANDFYCNSYPVSFSYRPSVWFGMSDADSTTYGSYQCISSIAPTGSGTLPSACLNRPSDKSALIGHPQGRFLVVGV